MTLAAAIALAGSPAGLAGVLMLGVVGMIIVLIVFALALVLRAARDPNHVDFMVKFSASLWKIFRFCIEVKSRR